MTVLGVVDEVWRYPVKSMQGAPVTAAVVGERGIVGDRAYALVDVADGKVASAKNPRKWGALLHCRAAYVDEPEPGVPLPPVVIAFPDGSDVRSDAADVDAVLSRYTGRQVTLSTDAPVNVRLEEFWPPVDGMAPQEFIDKDRVETGDPDEVVTDVTAAQAAPGTWFDLAPLHVVTTATLAAAGIAAAGDAAAPPVDRRRFRANLVIRPSGTTSGFVENDWVHRTIAVGAGGMRFFPALPAPRCVMTTLEQPDVAADRRVLQGLTDANRLEIPGNGMWACAGLYCGVAAPGPIAPGDEVTPAT